MTKQIYEIYYDGEADFLEVFFGEPTKAYTEEPEEGVFIRKDEIIEEIKSIGILAFKKRAKEMILKRILKQLGISIPLQIS